MTLLRRIAETLAVGYFNVGAEFEHLQYYNEAMHNYKKALKFIYLSEHGPQKSPDIIKILRQRN